MIDLRRAGRAFFRSRRIGGIFQPDDLAAVLIRALEDFDFCVLVLGVPYAEDIVGSGRKTAGGNCQRQHHGNTCGQFSHRCPLVMSDRTTFMFRGSSSSVSLGVSMILGISRKTGWFRSSLNPSSP